MHKKKMYWFTLVTALFLAAVAGCHQSNPDPRPKTPDPKPQTPDPERTVARLHWLGKKRLAAESNATNFMALWHLPESAKLEAQTLDQLATAPWRLWQTNTPVSTAPTALLRPLLDDLVSEESYLEVQAATNQPGAFVLAVRLSAERAALWRTNLPIILQSLSATQLPTPNSQLPNTDFRLQTSDFRLILTRSGDWTLLSVSRPATRDPQPSNLLADFANRIQRDHAPFAAPTTNYWLELDADLPALGLPPSSFILEPSSLSLTVIGDGANVRTRGELNFSRPLPIELEPWNLPTNLVHDPIIGFMAMRGIRPWLASWKFWSEHQLGLPPNQAFFWAQDGLPALHFFALPSAQASNQVHLLSEFLLNQVNPRIALFPNTTNMPIGSFERVPDSSLLRWRGLPYFAPNLDLTDAGGNPFITGGLFRNTLTNNPAPAELLRQFQTDTKLVFYDWENTQPCAFSLIQMSQAGRFVFGRARLSLTNNAALPWLVAISPKLGLAGTSVQLADPQRLTFSRSSTLGLTGVELHLLADWLESPTFPKGFFSLAAKPVPPVPAPAPSPPTKP